jgi:hypothetical protein
MNQVNSQSVFRAVLAALVAVIFAALGCGKGFEAERIAGPLEASCGFVQSSSGARVSWKNKLPVKVYISSSWPKEYVNVVKRAAQDWNEATSRDLIEVASGTPSDSPSKDKKNGIYWLKTWSASRRTEQAQTTLYYNQGVPYDGDIKVDAYFFTYYDNDPDRGEYHLESLLIHEMGHLLGLAHAYSAGTVMYPYLYPYDVRTKITDNDLKSISCEYPK